MSSNLESQCTEEGICAVPSTPNQQTGRLSNTGPSGVIKIDVVSDNICPWCFVGKRKLDAALSRFPNVQFEVEFHPFFLADPHMYPDPEPVQSFLAKRYGPQSARLENHLKIAGAEVGIHFSDARLVVNTVDSHLLMAFAKTHGKQLELANTLFASYFEGAENIGNKKVLIQIAESVNLDGAAFDNYLNDQNREMIIHEAAQVNSIYKVRGVPHYVIRSGNSEPFSVSGAQDPATFERIINRLLDAEK